MLNVQKKLLILTFFVNSCSAQQQNIANAFFSSGLSNMEELLTKKLEYPTLV
jgi:hypothetical protein